ncbi:MAG: NADH-quinone oxidoreductase subunit F [Thermoleophilia bacterium]|nr:NADH-quinone oxidoreductase subunit F [Thermoleophilia bacterium]
MPFENRVALRNVGHVYPQHLDECIAAGGYVGLERALGLGPEAAIAELERAGLRGRGGAGFPTARKWRACRSAEGAEKYAVCNAGDADPAARTARLLIGGDPHCVLEGLLIGAFAVGATQGYVCINAEYTEEIRVLEGALAQMRQRGLLGDDILGSGVSLELTVKQIAGSMAVWEETALIKALEGRQPLPELRPPYPAVKGLHGRPTLVNAAETLANVSVVLRDTVVKEGAAGNGAAGNGAAGNGPGGVAATGAAGTKVVTVAGDVGRERTVEIPLGTTLRELLAGVEGVEAAALDVKAVQFGGPTGAFFAGASLDTPISFEALEAAGCAMGSGTLRVFGAGACAVEMARDAMAYLRDESCGKCPACREGTYQAAELLAGIAGSEGKPEDLEVLAELGEAMKTGSICGFGRTASAPLLSSLDLFADDYRAHLDGRGCPARSGA